MNEPLIHSHWLAHAAPKAAPALATSTVLILGRIWNANGAEHSLGNAVLMAALAAGCAAAGTIAAAGRSGDPTLSATAFATSGALTLAGVAGYADGWSLPVLLWAVATTTAYTVAARHWRTDRRNTTAHHRNATTRREDHAHAERVEAIRGRTQIEVAREGTAYAEALAAALTARAALPGYDPAALHKAGLPELPTIERASE